jgi:hypothetical protein
VGKGEGTMRIQKIEFWHNGKSLILENVSWGKRVVKAQIAETSAEKYRSLPRFVQHKRTPNTAILKKAEEWAAELADGENETVVRAIYDTICRMVVCK